MQMWIPHRKDGDQTPIEARKFSHYVGQVRHWFCFHESLEHVNEWTVSHFESGWKVTTFNSITLMACRSDKRDAARMALNKLIERVGESKVAGVLNSAPAR
jgi:hypothetical protein